MHIINFISSFSISSFTQHVGFFQEAKQQTFAQNLQNPRVIQIKQAQTPADLVKVITETLTIKELQLYQKEIQEVVKRLPFDENAYNSFIEQLTEFAIKSIHSEQICSFLSQVIETRSLNPLVRQKVAKLLRNPADVKFAFKSATEWAKRNVSQCPLPIQSSFRGYLKWEWRKNCPFIITFIFAIINIAINAFNFLHYRKFLAPWESHLILDIFQKLFFELPSTLIHILQPILITPTKVYLVATITISLLGTAIFIYQRWLKPVPNDIVACDNLSEYAEFSRLELSVAKPKELNRLTEALLAGSNVVIKGQSGDGKTALIEYLAYLKQEGKLPKKLQKREFKWLKCGELLSNPSYGYQDSINQIKQKISGFAGRLLIIIEEVDRLAEQRGCLNTLKEQLLKIEGLRFIVTTTNQRYEAIEEEDDGSFWGRFEGKIQMDSEADEQHNRTIIRKYMKLRAPDVPITEEGVETILQISKDPGIVASKRGRPARISEILKKLIAICGSSYNSGYIPDTLAQEQCNLQELGLKPYSIENQRAIERLEEQIETMKKKLQICKDQAQKIVNLRKKERAFTRRYYELTHQLANPPSLKKWNFVFKKSFQVHEQTQKLYLLYCFYVLEAFQKVEKQEIERLKQLASDNQIVMDTQIDAALVKRIFLEKPEN